MDEFADRKSWILTGSVAVLLATPFLVQAWNGSHSRGDAVREYVAGMTETERQRLQRNFEEFQALSPEEMQKLRRLHAAVQQDPQLQRVLNAYYEWFKTRSTWERYELRPDEPIERRVERVHAILDREEERRGGLSERWRRSHRSFGPRLGADDVGPILEAVEKSLVEVSQQLPSGTPGPSAEPATSKFATLRQHIAALRRVIAAMGSGAVPGSTGPWSAGDIPIDEWVSAIEDSSRREELREYLRKLPADGRVRSFAVKLWFGVWDEYRREWERVRTPSEERDQRLKEFLLSLDNERRDYYLSLPPEKYEEELRERYFEAKHPELDRLHNDLWAVWEDIRTTWPRDRGRVAVPRGTDGSGSGDFMRRGRSSFGPPNRSER